MGMLTDRNYIPGAMQESHILMLHEAIARNAGIVLSLPSAGMLRHCKSRFLGQEESGFWVEMVPEQRPLIRELMERRTLCGISFKSGTVKVLCAAPLLGHNETYHVNSTLTLDALFMGYPQELHAMQRRANYRVRVVPERDDLSVRLWRMVRHATLEDVPPATQQIPATLRDVSTGGIGIILTQPTRIDPEDRLRIALDAGGQTLLLEGRMRYPTQSTTTPNVPAGISFWNLGQDLAGRRTLAQLHRLVGEMQRREVRRMRLGITRVAI